MGNVYRYTPLFFYEFFISIYFINTHEYTKRKFAYRHIEIKKYVCALIWYQVR